MATSVGHKTVKQKMGRFATSLMERVFGEEFVVRDRTIIVHDADNNDTTANFSTPAVIDAKLVRALYHNTNNQYALAAQLVKPIIDANVSFIGIPTVRSKNTEVLEAVKTFMKQLPFNTVHRIAEREGTAYVWPQIDMDGSIRFEVIRPETVKSTIIDPMTKKIVGYIIQDMFSFKDLSDQVHNITIDVTIDEKRITKQITCDIANLNKPAVTHRNVFGFLPIVTFLNDAEPWEQRGHSEIENIEPQLKLYHDITVEANRAQKRDGHPKMVIHTSDVKGWVENNFGTGYYEQLRKGLVKLTLDQRDLYLCETGGGIEDDREDVKYIESNKTTGEYNNLAEKTFTNVIEGGQTPEIMMGASMGASLSSVKEQRPAYIKKIEKKQQQYEASWRKLIIMALMIKGFVEFKEYDTEDFTLVWPTPDFATEKEKADTLNTLSTSLIKMRQANIMGDKEIYATIKKFDILEVEQDDTKHKQDIEETAEFIVKHEEDKKASQDNKMNGRVADGEYDNKKDGDTPQEETDAEKE